MRGFTPPLPNTSSSRDTYLSAGTTSSSSYQYRSKEYPSATIKLPNFEAKQDYCWKGKGKVPVLLFD
jgi:hypothetical protein